MSLAGGAQFTDNGAVSMKKIMLILMAVFWLALPAAAHHLWVVPADGGFLIARGLAPAEFHPYTPACVKEIKAFGKEGGLIPLKRLDAADQVRVTAASPPAMVTVVCEWGARVNTPEGERFLTKKAAQDQGMKVEEAFTSTQFGKTIFAWGEALARPAGLRLEIVPLKDPLALKPGEELPVQVLLDGAPLPNCRVRAAKMTELLETDQKGTINLKLPGKGLQVIYAGQRLPSPDKSTLDFLLFTTFLTFTVK